MKALHTALWKIAWRNVLRHARRNSLAIAMLAISFASVALFLAFRYRTEKHWLVNAAYVNYLGHLSVFQRGGLERSLVDKSFLLTAEQQGFLTERLLRDPDVEFVGRFLYLTGGLSNGCLVIPFRALGVDLGAEARAFRHPELVKWFGLTDPSPLSQTLAAHLKKAENPVALTPKMAKNLGKKATYADVQTPNYAPITNCGSEATNQRIAQDPQVRLIVESSSEGHAIYDADIAYLHTTGRMFEEDVGLRAPLAFVQKLAGTDAVSYIGIFLRPGVDSDELKARLPAIVGERAKEFEAFSALGPELNAIDYGARRWCITLEIFSESLVALIIIVTIVNFLAMTVRERAGEIGTLVALGFEPKTIFSVFQKEVLLIGWIAIFIGALIVFLVETAVNWAKVEYSPPGVAGQAYFLLASSPWHLVAVATVLNSLVWLVTSATFYALTRKASAYQLLNQR